MLINLSNHPSANWSAEQKQVAEQQFGEIVDLPFPTVDPNGDEGYIATLSREYFQKVRTMSSGKNVTVHLMGEMTFTFALVQQLQAQGIPCVASTTKRVTRNLPNGIQESKFQFVKFRNY